MAQNQDYPYSSPDTSKNNVTDAPILETFYPTGNHVPLYAPIRFIIRDSVNGVDTVSLTAVLNDTLDILTTATTTATEPGGYEILYNNPSKLFGYAQHVSLHITANDLAEPPNALDTIINFFTDSISPLVGIDIYEYSDSDTSTIALQFGLSAYGTKYYEYGIDQEVAPPPPSFYAYFDAAFDTSLTISLSRDIRYYGAQINLWAIKIVNTSMSNQECRWDSTVLVALDTLFEFKIGTSFSDSSTVTSWYPMESKSTLEFNPGEIIFIKEIKNYTSIEQPIAHNGEAHHPLNIFPNPATDKAFVEYFLDEAACVKLELLAINGQVVGLIETTRQQRGKHLATLNSSDMEAGVYLCRLITDKYCQVSKILLLK